MSNEHTRHPLPSPPDEARRSGSAWSAALIRDLVHHLGRKAHELPPETRALPHSADARTTILLVVATDLVVEALVDLMLPPVWRAVHLGWVFLATVATVGFCAMTARAPHLLDGRFLLLRTGPFRELSVPLDAIVSVRAAHDATVGHGLRRRAADEEAVACSVSSATTLTLETAEPLPVRLRDGGTVLARRIHFTADRPADAARLIREAIGGAAQNR
ncbi:hypothetical protein [Streptomyces sp. NPDC055005]